MSTAVAAPAAAGAPQRLWNSAEVWRFLNVHECTLRRYMRRKLLTGVKVGGRWKFDPAEVMRFAQGGPPPEGARDGE